MSKLKRALSLINLMQNRAVVTIKMIGEACGIPRRSAFRLLNELSEENIPLYYDAESRGYRLNTKSKLSLDNLDLSDSIMILFALELLCRELNESYGKEAQHLIKRVCVRQDYALESVLEVMQPYADSGETSKNHSGYLSFLFATAGVQFNKRLRISKTDAKNGEETQEIHKPSLRFHKDWYLVDTKEGSPAGTPLSKIDKVTILKQN